MNKLIIKVLKKKALNLAKKQGISNAIARAKDKLDTTKALVIAAQSVRRAILKSGEVITAIIKTKLSPFYNSWG